MKKKIVFLTGTRADFGKLKSLINIAIDAGLFEVHIFVTGMHLQEKYGHTVDEIIKCGYTNIHTYSNTAAKNSMERNLAKTIEGLSKFIQDIEPDLIVVHGDRVETLAGAIVGALNNILVAHVEGGEVSGTVDELIRHAVSKMSHTHFVSNKNAEKRLIQMGELQENIFEIGSPDVDMMLSDNLPGLEEVKKHYGIPFEKYSILMFHPVTTEYEAIGKYAKNLVDAAIESGLPYVVIYPNNDTGSLAILKQYKKLQHNPNFKIFPSIRFEYFLVLLKHCRFIIGNSSAGIREAPYYGLPAINIGSRQQNRALHEDIIMCSYNKEDILDAIAKANSSFFEPSTLFGKGDSDERFLKVISQNEFWQISKQKLFKDFSS